MGKDLASMAGSTDPQLINSMRAPFWNSSSKKMASASIPIRPSAMPTTAYIAMREYALTIYHHAQMFSSHIQGKFAWESSWANSLSILTLGALICFSIMYSYVIVDRRRRNTSNKKVSGPNWEKQYDQDSDDFDYEDDSDEDSNQQSGLTQPIRRFLSFRRTGRPGSIIKSAGIVRITSSDPRSSLSSVPIQLDMDSKTAVTPTEGNQDPSVVNMMQQSASVARRRRESGRLFNGVNAASSSTRTNSPLGRSSPSRKGGSLNHSASPARPPRAPRSQLSKSGQESLSDTDIDQLKGIIPSASLQSFTSITGEEEDTSAASMVPTSILFRQPQVYAGKPRLETGPSSHELYSLNRNASGSAIWQNSPVESSNEFSYGLHMPPPTIVGGSRGLPPGAGHAPSSPLHSPSLKLGSMDAAQIQSYWFERKSKSIRLQEPDWAPYVDVHIRAKERLETAAHVAANPQSTMLSPIRASLGLLGDSSPVDSSEKGSGSHQSAGEEEEFWYERFTQSTAAAGRDWDWRKRRRQRQMAAAAKADEDVLRSLNGSADSDVLGAGNVGMTDVQLQKQRIEHAKKLYDKDEEGGNARPILTVSTKNSILARTASPNGKQTPLGRRLKRYSSPMTDSPIEGENDATTASPNGATIMKKSSKNGRKHSKRHSEPENEEADLSVPSRLSSLTPKLMKRSIGARRERDADLTKQLLAEAEDVATDEEGEGRRETEMTASPSPRGVFGLRKSASASRLVFNKPDALAETPPVPIRSAAHDDSWGTGAGAWSSADAYGTSAPSHPFKTSTPKGDFSPPTSPARILAARNTSEYLLAGGGGEQLRRQGSKADSQGSGSSNSHLPVFATARSGSRKGILSSASRAANGDSPRREEGSPMRTSDSYNPLPVAMPTQ